MEKLKSCRLLKSALCVLFLILSLTSYAEAKSKIVNIKGVNYNVNSSLSDNLKLFIGKRVYFTLNSGKLISGFVKNVGNHLVHVEKLNNKDLFDALIRIENISAIDTRFRTLKRK